MKPEIAERLGPPSVRLAAFQLWVHSREFPDAQDEWDGNWLNVTAHCGNAGASVRVTGPLLDTIGLAVFRNGLERVHRTGSGEAVLDSVEPNVRVRVAASAQAGHLIARVELTPALTTQGHWFEFEVDFDSLPATVAQLESVLLQFPIRRGEGRRVLLAGLVDRFGDLD